MESKALMYYVPHQFRISTEFSMWINVKLMNQFHRITFMRHRKSLLNSCERRKVYANKSHNKLNAFLILRLRVSFVRMPLVAFFRFASSSHKIGWQNLQVGIFNTEIPFTAKTFFGAPHRSQPAQAKKNEKRTNNNRHWSLNEMSPTRCFVCCNGIIYLLDAQHVWNWGMRK